jgi:E3 ubiquitin-protein ligase BRE1
MGNGIGPSSTVILQDTSELEELAASRLQQLGALRTDLTGLQQENDRLRLLVSGCTSVVIQSLKIST